MSILANPGDLNVLNLLFAEVYLYWSVDGAGVEMSITKPSPSRQSNVLRDSEMKFENRSRRTFDAAI